MVIVAPIINIINKIESIQVNTSIIKATPPITSNNPSGSANAAGNPILLANSASVLDSTQLKKILIDFISISYSTFIALPFVFVCFFLNVISSIPLL
jgi:hypothetical protein